MVNKGNIVVIGGGAAGFFAAITAAKNHPDFSVILLEKTNQLLSKVRVSGGGRCNVTHACFDPKELAIHYPRGSKELLGPFSRFQPKDTIEWFESRGVALKKEGDGRMFPVTNSSQTIIDTLLEAAREYGVEIRLQSHLKEIKKVKEDFLITFSSLESLVANRLVLATGSNALGHQLAQTLGHSIIEPVPSLFTFNVPESALKGLSGISTTATIKIKNTALMQTGTLLITHFGFSGPAILKLSAFGARVLHDLKYKAEIEIDWVGKFEVEKCLIEQKKITPDQQLSNVHLFSLPRNLWKAFTQEYVKKVKDLSHKEIAALARRLKCDCYQIEGKTTHKEEFVTAGGVHLKEVNFKTMESRICPGLYFAGEILDIDGVTGGFNFQNAWTTGFLAGNNCGQADT